VQSMLSVTMTVHHVATQGLPMWGFFSKVVLFRK